MKNKTKAKNNKIMKINGKTKQKQKTI